MVKKIARFLMVMALVLSCTNCFSESMYVNAAQIGIDSLYTSKVQTTFSISSSGKATAVCDIVGIRTSTTKVIIYAYLQQKVNGTWSTISNDSGSYDSYTGTLVLTSNVQSGYEYRVKVSYYAYSGDKYEITQDISATKKY